MDLFFSPVWIVRVNNNNGHVLVLWKLEVQFVCDFCLFVSDSVELIIFDKSSGRIANYVLVNLS